MILAAFLLLQAVDITTTLLIVRGGGIELNPILPTDPVRHVVVKVAIIGLIVADGRGVPLAALFTCVAVIWNLRQLYRSRRAAAREAQ